MFISRFKWVLSTRRVSTTSRNPYSVSRLVRILNQMPAKDMSVKGLDDVVLAERKTQKRFIGNVETSSVEKLVAYSYGPQITRQIAQTFLSKAMIEFTEQEATFMIAFFLRLNGLRAAETVFHRSQFLQLQLPNSVLAMFIRALYKIKGGASRKLNSTAESTAAVFASLTIDPENETPVDPAVLSTFNSECETHTSIYMSQLFNMLKSFKRRGFEADSLVWNAVLTALPSFETKASFYSEMIQHGIRPIEYFMNDITPTVLDVVLNNSKANLAYLHSNPFQLLYAMSNSDALREELVGRRLKKNGLAQIQETLQIALERPTPKMRLLFLQFFASIHRIDYQFGVLNLFNFPLDADAYEALLKAAAYSKSRGDKGLSTLPNRVELVCTIVEQMWRENLILTNKGRVIARRAIKRFNDLGIVPREYKDEGWTLLRQGLCWQIPPKASSPKLLNPAPGTALDVKRMSDSTQMTPNMTLLTEDNLFSLLINDGVHLRTKNDIPCPADPLLLKSIGCSEAGTQLPYYSVPNGFNAIGNTAPTRD